MMDSSLEKLKKLSVPKRYNKNEYICHQGHMGDEMYILLSGKVGIYTINDLGKLEQVACMNPGDFFGEMSIFDRQPRSATCIALEESICMTIDKKNVKTFLEQCPDFALKILKSMSNRVRSLNEELYRNGKGTKN